MTVMETHFATGHTPLRKELYDGSISKANYLSGTSYRHNFTVSVSRISLVGTRVNISILQNIDFSHGIYS